MRSVAVLLFAFAVYAAALPAPEPADEWAEVDPEVDRSGFAKDPKGGLPLKHVFDKGDGMHSGEVTLTYKPLSKRCFKFPAGDSLVAWSETDIAKEGMDPRCYTKKYLAQHTNDPDWKCSGGFPFYRWKALDMTESQCMMYCLSKGMDAFAYVHEGANTGPRDTECRCGATVDNLDVWNGITPPSFLLPPNQDDPLGKDISEATGDECNIEAFVYSGTMKHGSTPGKLMFPDIADESYIDSIVAGCHIEHEEDDGEGKTGVCSDGETPRDGFESKHNHQKAKLVQVSPPSHEAAMRSEFGEGQQAADSLVQIRCQDNVPSGFSSGGVSLTCADLKNRFNACGQSNVQNACPVTCEQCTAGEVYPKCWPDACGPALPWPTRAAQTTGKWRQIVRIPYAYSTTDTVDEARITVVNSARAALLEATCIDIYPVSSTSQFGADGAGLDIGARGQCSVRGLGWASGRTTLVQLGWCNSMRYRGSVIHELMHAIGINHEQKRPDAGTKDDLINQGPFLAINWQNIPSDWQSQFTPDVHSYVGSQDDGADDVHVGYSAYDFGSLMHYGKNSGSFRNAYETIPAGMPVGQRTRISASDAEQMNDMYQCQLLADTPPPPTPTPPTPTPTPPTPTPPTPTPLPTNPLPTPTPTPLPTNPLPTPTPTPLPTNPLPTPTPTPLPTNPLPTPTPTPLPTNPLPTPTPTPTPATSTPPKYLGCFKDARSRDLPVRKRPNTMGAAGVETCKAACAGFAVFGRQWRGECFCGNKYGSSGRATGCQCEAATNIGSWKNCVYEVSPGSDPGYTPPPCRDRWGSCPRYKRYGYCERFSFVPRYCPLSCGNCPEELEEGGEVEDVSEEMAVHLLQDAEAQEETWNE